MNYAENSRKQNNRHRPSDISGTHLKPCILHDFEHVPDIYLAMPCFFD